MLKKREKEVKGIRNRKKGEKIDVGDGLEHLLNRVVEGYT